MYKVTLEQFEGPLDLLLKLCEQEKLAISDISLARIADAYCDEIKRQPIPIAELADFLVIASQLLLVKSRLLLPGFLAPEEEPVPDLEIKLNVYRMYTDAAVHIRHALRTHKPLFARDSVPQGWEKMMPQGRVFIPPTSLNPITLQRISEHVIKVLERISISLPQEAIRKVARLEDKVFALKAWLVGKTTSTFHDAVSRHAPKIEIILHFLAILELAKERYVFVEQEELWGDIIIHKEPVS